MNLPEKQLRFDSQGELEKGPLSTQANKKLSELQTTKFNDFVNMCDKHFRLGAYEAITASLRVNDAAMDKAFQEFVLERYPNRCEILGKSRIEPLPYPCDRLVDIWRCEELAPPWIKLCNN